MKKGQFLILEHLRSEEALQQSRDQSLQDITKRKKAEENWRQLNEALEQRVRERTRELEAKNAELNDLNRIFVGRELRMVELKKRISELDNKQ